MSFCLLIHQACDNMDMWICLLVAYKQKEKEEPMMGL
jgi:hypothetical protein